MKKILYTLFILLAVVDISHAQTDSPLKVKYMITHDSQKNLFTAWVVPSYDTPNINNPDTEERGVTAQFTLRVPRGYKLSYLSDVRGVWEKNPVAIGTQEGFAKAGISTNYEYYVIGKSNAETNFGTFKKGEPVAIFTFAGSGESPEKVTILDGHDPFVKIVDKYFALNIQNSFYSRSGQSAASTTRPLEQGSGSITLKEMIAEIANQVVATTDNEEFSKVLVYPNPTSDLVNLKFFVERSDANISIDLINISGNNQSLKKMKGTLGINNTQISLKDFTSGLYILKTVIDDNIYTQKVIKN